MRALMVTMLRGGSSSLLHPLMLISDFCCGILLSGACLHDFAGPSHRSWPRSFTAFRFVFLVVAGCRFGQAANARPRDKDVTNDFCIGCSNPSGLTGKAQVINQYLRQCDTLAVTETHWSTRTASSFQRFTSHQITVPIHGHWLSCRSSGPLQSSGGWRGVAALSKHPTGTFPTPWGADLYDINYCMTCGPPWAPCIGNQQVHATRTTCNTMKFSYVQLPPRYASIPRAACRRRGFQPGRTNMMFRLLKSLNQRDLKMFNLLPTIVGENHPQPM